MANPFYVVSGNPGTGAPLTSAAIRAEFTAIAAGFDKLPTALTANKAVVVNSGGTGLTITTGSLALGGDFTVSGASALTLTTTGATNVTLPTTGTLATLAGTEILSNKTLAAPVLGTPASGTLTSCTGLPIATGVSGLGTGIATALAVATGSAGAPVLFNGAAGTPSSITLTNGTGLPGTGILAAGTAWTPTDNSGAGLVFTNVNCKYQQIGNLIFAYYRFTYPATGSGAGASIAGLPVASANQTYSPVPSPVQFSGGAAPQTAVVVQGASTFNFVLNSTGGGIPNSSMTTLTPNGLLIYPVS